MRTMAPAGRTVRNAVYILTSDVAGRASTFLVYALIARFLGAEPLGQMALALALFYTLQVIAAAGLRTNMTREIARNGGAVSRQLASGTVLATLAASLSMVVLATFVWLTGYSGETVWVVLLLGLGLLPYAMSVVCEAVFQASEVMRYIAYAQVPVHVAKVAFAWLLLVQGGTIRQLAMLLLACHTAVAAIEWLLMLRYVARPRFDRTEPRAATFIGGLRDSLKMGRSAGTFLVIDALIAIGAGLNVVLLSALSSESTA